MKKLWAEFMKFIKRGNVVDMAVGVAVASAFTAIVTAFTKGFISPLLALLTGESNMTEMKWILREQVLAEDGVTVEVAEVAILWGAFLQAIIDFLIIALALFIVMKVAAAMRDRAIRIHAEMRNALTHEDELAEAERLAAEQAAAEEKAAEEARLAAEQQAAAEAEECERRRKERELELLEEIRDLLRAGRSVASDENTEK